MKRFTSRFSNMVEVCDSASGYLYYAKNNLLRDHRLEDENKDTPKEL